MGYGKQNLAFILHLPMTNTFFGSCGRNLPISLGIPVENALPRIYGLSDVLKIDYR